jgi:glycerol kinase
VSDVNTISDLASSVSDTNGATFVPTLFGASAPYNKSTAHGAFLGLTTAVTRAHLVRAVLEGLAWRVFDMVQAIDNGGGTRIKSLRVGGGVARNDFLCQFLSDICQKEVRRSVDVEATVRGAAMLGGIACGWFQWTDAGREELRRVSCAKESLFKPTMSVQERDKRLMLWHDSVDRVTR